MSFTVGGGVWSTIKSFGGSLAPSFLITSLPIWIKLQDKKFFGFLCQISSKCNRDVKLPRESHLPLTRKGTRKRDEEEETLLWQRWIKSTHIQPLSYLCSVCLWSRFFLFLENLSLESDSWKLGTTLATDAKRANKPLRTWDETSMNRDEKSLERRKVCINTSVPQRRSTTFSYNPSPSAALSPSANYHDLWRLVFLFWRRLVALCGLASLRQLLQRHAVVLRSSSCRSVFNPTPTRPPPSPRSPSPPFSLPSLPGELGHLLHQMGRANSIQQLHTGKKLDKVSFMLRLLLVVQLETGSTLRDFAQLERTNANHVWCLRNWCVFQIVFSLELGFLEWVEGSSRRSLILNKLNLHSPQNTPKPNSVVKVLI